MICYENHIYLDSRLFYLLSVSSKKRNPKSSYRTYVQYDRRKHTSYALFVGNHGFNLKFNETIKSEFVVFLYVQVSSKFTLSAHFFNRYFFCSLFFFFCVVSLLFTRFHVTNYIANFLSQNYLTLISVFLSILFLVSNLIIEIISHFSHTHTHIVIWIHICDCRSRIICEVFQLFFFREFIHWSP